MIGRVLIPGVLVLLGGCAGMQPPPPMPVPVAAVTPPPKTADGSIYQDGQDVRLFESRVAHRPGDVITVMLEEQTDASKEASTKLSKNSDLSMGIPNVLGHDLSFGGTSLSGSATTNRSMDGSGTADQKNQLSGTITATVIQVQPNGNLVIQGRKVLTLSDGTEYVTITGVVRPDDVGADNTVSSTRVAQAQISYTGSGQVHDTQVFGILARLFMSVIWPL